MTTCPPTERLASLLDDELPATHKAPLEDHLSGCSRCQQTLLGLAIDTVELQRQEQLLRPEADELQAPAELLDGLKRSCIASSRRTANLEPTPAPTLPGYEILGEVGRGGMAVVYRARQVGLNRLVALKIILAGRHASAELRDRFRREAEAVARLRHPHIIQIHEIGEHDGTPYFSMELVEGGSLKDRLRAREHTPTESASLVETLARAIHAAHLAGVVHRDLKPANILLANEPRSALLPVIADFGLALHGDANNGWTRTGDVLGTPQYMAPEQAQGRRGDVGPATDIHALGVILYEMLTGRTPFAADDDVRMLLQVSFEEPLPPRRLKSSLPRDLETICLKCLRKLPSQRYSTALELAEDLRRFQAGEPINARPISGRERVVKWVRRYPVVASLLAGLVVVTVVGFTGVTWALLEARTARDEETIQRRKAEDAAGKTLEALDQSERSVYFGTIAQARSQWLLNNVPASARLLARCREERRGWEWHYLRGLNHGDLLTITDTEAAWITRVAYSPDGRSIASGGGDPFARPEAGVIQVHDVETGHLRWRKSGLSPMVRSVAFSPDGRFLATVSGPWREFGEGQVQMWDAATGEVVSKFPDRVEHGLLGLAFSPDGRRLATICENRPGRIWDTTTGKELCRTTHARGDFVGFSPGGQHFVFDGPNGLEVHATADGKLLRNFPQVRGLAAVGPDWAKLATVDAGQVSIWDVTPAKGADDFERMEITLAKSFEGHAGGISAVAFRPDGQAVATSGLDGTVCLRELGGEAEPVVYRGHEGRVATVAFHPDGRQLASGGMQPGNVKIWDATRKPEGVEAVSFAADRRDISAIGFTGDDRELLVLSVGGILRRWGCRTGSLSERELPMTNAWLVPATPAAFSSDGKLLAAVSDSNAVRVLETATGRELAVLRGSTLRVRFVACDRDCTRVVTAADGAKVGRPVRELKVWDVQSAKFIHEQTVFNEQCLAVAISPDGTRLLEANRTLPRDGQPKGTLPGVRLTLSSLGGEEPQSVLPTPGSVVLALAFSPRGTYFTVGTINGEVRIYDREGKPIHEKPLPGPEGLGGLAFSPDETRLAGVNRERVQVWDVASGQDVLFLRGAGNRHSDNAFNPRVAWSHDGLRLAVSNWNRTTTVWDATDFTTASGKAVLREQVANRALDWHVGHAESARGNPFATEFHLARLLSVKGLAPSQRRLRGESLAQWGRWNEATDDFASLVADDVPESPSVCEAYAVLLAKRGAIAAYRAFRRRVLTRFSQSGDTSDPLPTLRLGGVHPTTAGESAQLLAIAQRYAKLHPQSSLPMEFLGLAHYRAGECDLAKPLLLHAIEVSGEGGEPIFAWITMALVHLQQGQPEKADPLLKRVESWLAARAKKAPWARGGVPDLDWLATVEVRLLWEEAVSLRMKSDPLPRR